MNLYKNLVLVGMMGSGKSSIGKILSQKLKFEFIDTDNIVEELEKKTISEIFKKNGEKYFRNIEEETTLKSLKLKNKVIALGGGGFLNPNIRKYILNKCISVWLNWKNEKLIDRIKNSKKRPLANKLNSSELIKLIIKRTTIYNLSHYKINCDKLNKKQIVNKIIEYYEST
ncbi:MAG: shikimate kinase [Candidatus Pelagibacter sp.]|tara:strand:+ start:53 stop:565 length:513 start_codon:yes stop_codon:yes gene_type:complete